MAAAMSARDSYPQADPAPAEAAPAWPANAGSCCTVDLPAIAANWRILDRKATPVECAAVVKADAYGCDTVQFARNPG